MFTRSLKDRLASRLMFLVTLSSSLIVFLMALALYARARPILTAKPLGELIFSSSWHPMKGEFGFYPFILGTLWVTALAMIISIPLSLLTAIYLAEYASARVRGVAKPLIDLLAGIPSVVYGLVGMILVIPLIRRIGGTGYSVLAASVVLAAMVLPTIISISEDSLRAVPTDYK